MVQLMSGLLQVLFLLLKALTSNLFCCRWPGDFKLKETSNSWRRRALKSVVQNDLFV